MTEYLDLILVGAVCGYIGYRIADHIHQSVIADLLHRAGVTPEKLESIMDDLRDEIESPGRAEEESFPKIEVRIEQHNGQMYAYRKDTEQFLGQGVDRESLLKIIAEKMSNVTLVIREEDGAALIKENPTA